jgi:pimeloyl-ACP methyl ester carboxylesterase
MEHVMRSTRNTYWHGRSRSKSGRLALSLVAVMAAATAACAAQSDQQVAATSASASDQLTAPAASPTIMLVHGAFADGGSWNAVSENLQQRNYQVVAPGIGLRGLAEDSAYIASYLKQLDGCVLLVGHSYGAAVITNAATGAANAVGLVFVSGLEPDKGERLSDVEKTSKDSVLNANLIKLTYPRGAGTAIEYLVKPDAFPAVFAGDLPKEEAAVLAAEQRPAADAAFSEPSGVPAWKTLPSWAVVASGDKAAGADVVRSTAKRAGAQITEIEGSHLIMVSQPAAVADVIATAAKAVADKC